MKNEMQMWALSLLYNNTLERRIYRFTMTSQTIVEKSLSL